ncbi:PAS domain S-box protein [Deltaproteobacteria bacterium TL4]
MKENAKTIQKMNQKMLKGLKRSRIFEFIPELVWEYILNCFSYEQFPAKTKILEESQENKFLYILLQGSVSYYGGDEPLFKMKRVGDILGESSLIRKNKASRTVIADSEVHLLKLSFETLKQEQEETKQTIQYLISPLLSVILSDKLMLSTQKARQFELTHTKLKRTQNNLQQAYSELEERNQQLQTEINEHQESEKKRAILATAIEQSAEVVIITDGQGNIEYVNPSFEQTTGYTAQEVLGENPKILNSRKVEPSVFKSLWKTITAGQAWHGRLINKKKDGTLFENEIVISPIRSDTGEVTHFVAVQRDITNELQLEKQLFQAQKMEELGTLIGSIAHEFNNLLAPVLGYTGLLLQDHPENEEKGYLQQVQQAGQQAKTLVQQVLAFSRRTTPKTESIEIQSVVKDVIEFLKPTLPKTITIKTNIPESLPRICANEQQIHQVLINLCINASQAMSDGGTLTISLTKKRPQSFFNSKKKKVKGPFVTLVVQDTGCGMSPLTMNSIFDPFFTTKAEGTGLGLSVVLGIVEQNGGLIKVESTLGQGSTFFVYYPEIIEDLEEETEDAETLIELGTERILLVDDDTLVRNITQMMLRKLGYTVTSFSEGSKALAAFQAHPADFDLIMTDYTMPEMNGAQLSQHLRNLRPNVLILLSTGYMEILDEEEPETFGVDAVLIKPYQLPELSQRLRQLLKRSGDV